MTFREQLEQLDACNESLEWVGNKTIEQAWKTCKNSDWMIWFLTKTDFDLTDSLCDIAERVLHLIPEDNRLVFNNVISAAKRRASKDELNSAAGAVFNANSAYFAAYAKANTETDYAASTSATAVATAAEYCIAARNAAKITIAKDDTRAYYARSTAANAAHARCSSVYYAYDAALKYYASAASWAAYRREQKEQCNILRKHFTIDQIKEAFNKLVA